MEKELLTRKIIKSDLYHLSLKELGAGCCFLLLFAVMTWWYLKCFNWEVISIYSVIPLVYAVCCLISAVYIVITIRTILKITQNKFVILRDKLASKTIQEYGYLFRNNLERYIFRFNHSGYFAFLQDTFFYNWSELNHTYTERLFEFSDISDDFIVVKISHKKIVMVYNLKYFDFQE